MNVLGNTRNRLFYCVEKYFKVKNQLNNLIAKKDYWSFSDIELEGLARKFNLKRWQLERNTEIEFGPHEKWLKTEHELRDSLRQEIIDELIKRDRFIRDYIAVCISVIALIISVIALFFN